MGALVVYATILAMLNTGEVTPPVYRINIIENYYLIYNTLVRLILRVR